MIFAQIIVDLSLEQVDRPFQYSVPEELVSKVRPGTRVQIPFGPRTMKGYVLALSEEPEFDVSKTKPIHKVIMEGEDAASELIALAGWMKEHTGSTLNQALKTVLPIKQNVKALTENFVELKLSKEAVQNLLADYQKGKRKEKRINTLQSLLQEPRQRKEALMKRCGVSATVLSNMEKDGILEIQSIRKYRMPFEVQEKDLIRKKIELTEEQQKVLAQIRENDDRKPHFIHGVTGSGKTEIYMELIEEALSQGKQAIVLIPEISLTYQSVLRYYSRFGSKVSVINSKLSPGEKYDQFDQAREGKIQVMIGPRSALFTPFSKLGLIIVDEEQESAYKSETMPRYHGVDVAIQRGKLTGARVVLGSATPSLSSYYKCMQKQFYLYTLEKKAVQGAGTKVSIVDMREELRKGNKTMFSDALAAGIKERLERGEQIMLFINRRAYASFVSCRACGEAVKCPHCDVSLKYHKKENLLQCHYCGYEISMMKTCPKCESIFVAPFGTGTEKVEEAVKATYPQARVLRMDMDTTRGKQDHSRIIEAFMEHKADILIGTQMIVKGHDFPKVTLVGIIAADLSLYAGDYSSAEKTFQLLTQAAGRAGRGNLMGECIIQTYHPEETSIQAAAAQNYLKFYEEEIAYRRMMKYPPTAGMLTIQLASKQEELLEKASKELAAKLEEKCNTSVLLGPSKAGIYKINDCYRQLIYIKGTEELYRMSEYADGFLQENSEYNDIMIQYDIME